MNPYDHPLLHLGLAHLLATLDNLDTPLKHSVYQAVRPVTWVASHSRTGVPAALWKLIFGFCEQLEASRLLRTCRRMSKFDLHENLLTLHVTETLGARFPTRTCALECIKWWRSPSLNLHYYKKLRTLEVHTHYLSLQLHVPTTGVYRRGEYIIEDFMRSNPHVALEAFGDVDRSHSCVRDLFSSIKSTTRFSYVPERLQRLRCHPMVPDTMSKFAHLTFLDCSAMLVNLNLKLSFPSVRTLIADRDEIYAHNFPVVEHIEAVRPTFLGTFTHLRYLKTVAERVDPARPFCPTSTLTATFPALREYDCVSLTVDRIL